MAFLACTNKKYPVYRVSGLLESRLKGYDGIRNEFKTSLKCHCCSPMQDREVWAVWSQGDGGESGVQGREAHAAGH